MSKEEKKEGGPDTRVPWVQAKLQRAFDGIKADKFTKAFTEPETL
jgi:hypothetical protein